MNKTLWICFVLFLVVVGYIASRPKDDSGSSTDQGAATDLHKLNEKVRTGYWSYTILNWQWADAVGSYPVFEKPDAKFLILELAVENDDRSASVLPPIKLLDTQGREYETSSACSSCGDYFWPLKKLNPGVTSRGKVAFDVPDGKYVVEVSGGIESNEKAMIDLASAPVVSQQGRGNAIDSNPPNPQESKPSADATQRTRNVEPENREARLIDKFCGNASDVDECVKQELPSLGTVNEEPPNFSDQARFQKAKNRCAPLFPDDAHMLVYCIQQIYSGLPPSQGH